MDGFNEHYWVEKPEVTSNMKEKFVRNNYVHLCEVMKKWEGFEEFQPKLEGKLDYFWENNYNYFTNPKYSVLNHGDLDVKNMMYRNEGLKNEDLLFVSLSKFAYNYLILLSFRLIFRVFIGLHLLWTSFSSLE